jgi:hypothetical protein
MNPLFENPVTELINPLAEIIKSVIGRIWPDPQQQADAQFKFAQLVQNGELAQLAASTDLAKAQINVNSIEAAGTGFKANWRPFLGWTCGAAYAWQYVAQPAFEWFALALGYPVSLPHADMAGMMPVLLGMLGLAGARTIEKIKDAA